MEPTELLMTQTYLSNGILRKTNWDQPAVDYKTGPKPVSGDKMSD